MERVYVRYPDDKEGAIFYALALNATASAVRQDLLEPKEGRSDFERDFRRAAEPSGCRALSHPQLRLGAACRIGVAGGDLPYSKIAPSVPSLASHAVTYFHATGQMAGLGRCKPRIAGRRPRLRASSLWRGRGLGSVAARHGLSRIRVPATWAGPCRKRACRRC